jgi:mannose-1-phosphate guanylyltransferase
MATMGSRESQWCIVSADDHGPEWAPNLAPECQRAPVQYTRFAGSTSLLQMAMHRAARFASAGQTMVTTLDEYREFWEPALWHVRPENRFVGDTRAASLLTGAAALLAIAHSSPSNVVTILPARCHVEREYILEAALDQARFILPSVSEGVMTLGMVDIGDPIDEDYLVASRAANGTGFEVRGFARRPAPWVARHLKQQGAMVSSGIMIGYAGAFAAHVSKHWPGLTYRLDQLHDRSKDAGVECEVSLALQDGVPRTVLGSLRWNPPSFPQRAFRVRGCGWAGLRTQRAVRAIAEHLSTSDAVEAI